MPRELIGFVVSRLAEEAQSAALFHELDCAGPARCRCPVPRQICARVAITRGIVGACEQRLLRGDVHGPGWPPGPLSAWKVLGAFALPYELHPSWQERWRP